ncbi:filamentous hemagglutinin N-terminal domain-containing protein [Proteus mirabilis]|nr:filamentous hemagglutinin N-terminal domain-containing protein [Proteus mirabilis]
MCEKDISWKQRLISYSIAYVIAIYPLHPAWSSAITPSDKTIKVNQQNTVPIINISTPNNLGISHNKFHSFNVSKQGVVINNATTSVNTQLAKQVNANTNLKGSAAHLIINEVVGNGRSQLQGKLEVAGEQAKVVIANPNGITCDGCSFINTPAITLTTGKPLFNPQGAYSAIEVKKGGVVIGTQGIDLQAQDYADIISRSIELNGKINAKNLSLMQGNNRIDFDKGTVNSINGEGVKPILSIDTKALGGMYANQIRLVSTEKGIGVNLSNIQTNQNSVNITVDGKITFNGNIQSEQDINVSSKELQINSNTKLKAKRDITLATNTLINHSEVISEKDMRLFADKLTNKGEKALIQAKDNLWIQRNAQGDPSTLIENQSATIKTEKGDLIIRTKKLVNTSLNELPTFLNVEANSTARKSFVASYWGNSQGVVSINTYYPVLENFPYEKWFGYLDLTSTDIINTERYKYNYSDFIGHIDSGKNIYINANELINNLGVIHSNENTILTGSNAVISNLMPGELNLWYRYKTSYKDLGVYVDEEDDDGNYDILYVREPLKFELLNKFYSWSPDRKSFSTILSKGNLVLDFKNSINIEANPPSKYLPIKKSINKLHSGYNFLANNILINSNSINISSNINSNNELSVISSGDIIVKDSHLSSKKSLSLISNKNIELNQVDLTAKDGVVLAKNGNIDYTLNPISAFNENNVLTPPAINVSDSILFQSGKDITFNNIEINNANFLSLISQGDIKIQRNESELFKILPYFHLYNKESALSKTESWKTRGDITFTAGKDIISQGIKYHSDKAITFNAGQDIFLASKSIKEADPFFSDIYYPQLQSKLFSDDNLILNAARDVDLSSTVLNSKDKVIVLAGRNIKLGANAYSAIKDPHEDSQDIQYSTSAITGNKGISIASSGALITEGSSLKSDGNITISSSGNIQLGSVRTYFRKESGSKLEELRKQVSTEINSGNNLTLLSEGSILFQASKLIANKKIDIAAKGGFLYAQAMEESSYYEEEKKKCNPWTLCTTKKKYTKKRHNTNNKVTEFIANGDINLFAKDDITLEASKLEIAKNAKLTSKTGKVNFKAVKNTAFKQVITNSKDIYITQRNQGYIKESWALPTLYIGGKLTIDAPKGISADIKVQKGQSLEQALTVLSNTPEYAWLKDLQHHQNVNWNLVKDTYSDWDDKTKQLNPVVGAVIAIAVGVATYGTATAATIGGMASKATIAAGASASVASTASVAAQAGFASLVSQAAVSLAENQGNISKTLESLGRSDTVKSVVTSMVVAGALQGLDQFMGWDQAIQGGTLPSTGKLLATDSATWNQVAQRVASHSVVSSTLGTAIQGGSFIDNFKTALLSNIGSQLHAEGANLIGDNGAVLGHAGKVLSHSVVAGVSAEIAGGSVTGAVAGALAAEIAAISLNDSLVKTEQWREQQAQRSRLVGAFAGLLATGKAEGVISAANSAELVERYNRQLHLEETNAINKLANGDKNKLERLLASSCRKVYCIAQESLDSSERNYYESLMKKYPYTHVEDSLLSDYWITKERTRIGGNYPLFSGYEKIKLFTYTEADKLTDSETFSRNQWIENASKFTGWDKKTLENLTSVIAIGASITRRNGNRIYGPISFNANKTQFIPINDIYFIDKSGNKITMKWMYQGTIVEQGMTFENYIGLSNKRLTRLHLNAKTFDYYDDRTDEYISVKTLNTQTASRIKNPKSIENTLNTYISTMDKYSGDGRGTTEISKKDVKLKTLELGVPEKTTKEQWDAINDSIKNASSKNIKVNITIIEE